MIRKLTKKKKRERRAANAVAVMEIYNRVKQGGSESYLAIHQESDPERVAKLKIAAQERRDRRNAKRTEKSIVQHPISISMWEPHRWNLRSRKGRVGKVRGFARRVLRKIAERSDSRGSAQAQG